MAHRRRIVLVWVAAGLFGLWLAGHYGLSTDESIQAAYGRTTWWSYLGLAQDGYGPADLPYYGPVYSALVEALGWGLQLLVPIWSIIEARHYLYFLTFLLGVLAFYDLTKRVVRPQYAAAAAALFATQPILFGHAFINPKDGPFMAFFLGTIAVGVRVIDHPAGRPDGEAKAPSASVVTGLSERWRSASRAQRLLLIFSLSILFLGLFELYWTRFVLRYVLGLIEQAYAGKGPALFGEFFSRLATQADSVALDSYLARARQLYSIPRRLVTLVLLALAALAMARFLGLERVRLWLYPWIPLATAGVLLGLTTSIRVAGPFAGVILSIYLIRQETRRLQSLAVLWGIAAVTTYATWPALWARPLAHLRESLAVMSGFSHNSLELYMGRLVPANAVPWSFVPHLILIQLTIPALVLALGGGVAAISGRFRTRRGSGWLLALGTAWLVIPLTVKLLGDSATYGNFRVLLFALPPIFLFAAVGLQCLGSWLRKPGLKVLLLAIVLAPGVIGIVQLHPYEYIYYNRLAGGTGTASQSFETDYWCTSLKEAMEYVNMLAPEGARVGVHRVSGLARPFAREDLRVFAVEEEAQVQAEDPDYVLVCPRSDFDRTFLAESPVIWRVERSGAELSAVKQP